MACSPHYVYAIIEERFIKSGKVVVKFGIGSRDSIDQSSFMIGMYNIKSTNIEDANASFMMAAQSILTPTSYGDDYFIGDRRDMLDIMLLIAKKYAPAWVDLMEMQKD